MSTKRRTDKPWDTLAGDTCHKRTHLEVLSETNQALKVRRALLQLSVTEIPGLGGGHRMERAMKELSRVLAILHFLIGCKGAFFSKLIELCT